MKKISLLVCVVVLLLSISVVAAASTTFFYSNRDGYRWVGSGSVSVSKATAKLTGTQNSTPYLPQVDCSAESWVRAYKSDGVMIGTMYNIGYTYSKAEYTTGAFNIYKMEAEFEYNGLHRGSFSLYV